MNETNRILPFKGILPQVDPSCFLAAGSWVIGDTQIQSGSSVWFNAVLRGDVNYIRVGSMTNIQDNATVHVTTGGNPCIIGDSVTVGHGATLHACEVGNGALIGMGATVLDGALIGAGSMVGANSLVSPNKVFPEGVLILGNPAKVRRDLTPEEIEAISISASHYHELSQSYIHSKPIAD